MIYLKLYHLSSLIKYEVGRGQNTDSFQCMEEPVEVRCYDSAHPNGVFLERMTTGTCPDDLQPGQWCWDADTNTVHLGEVCSDTVIAFTGDIFLFDDEPLPVFGDESTRTKIWEVHARNVSADKYLTAIQISTYEFYDTDEDVHTWLKLSTDQTSWVDVISFASLDPAEEATFYVKVTVPEGHDIIIYRNVGLKVDYHVEFNE